MTICHEIVFEMKRKFTQKCTFGHHLLALMNKTLKRLKMPFVHTLNVKVSKFGPQHFSK